MYTCDLCGSASPAKRWRPALDLEGRRGEHGGQTGHPYLRRQTWSVGNKKKTHGVFSRAGSESTLKHSNVDSDCKHNQFLMIRVWPWNFVFVRFGIGREVVSFGLGRPINAGGSGVFTLGAEASFPCSARTPSASKTSNTQANTGAIGVGQRRRDGRCSPARCHVVCWYQF